MLSRFFVLAFALSLSFSAAADYPALQRWVSNTQYIQGSFGSLSSCKDAVDKKFNNKCVWTDGYGDDPRASLCRIGNGHAYPCRPISSCPYGGSLRGNVCANTDVSAEPNCFGLNSEQLMGNGGNIYNCENDRIMRYEPVGSENVSTPSEGSDPDLPPYLVCGDYIKSDTGKSCGSDNSGVPGGTPTDVCAKDDYECWKDCYESGHTCVAEIGDGEGGGGEDGEGADDGNEDGDGEEDVEGEGDGDGDGEEEGEGKDKEEDDEGTVKKPGDVKTGKFDMEKANKDVVAAENAFRDAFDSIKSQINARYHALPEGGGALPSCFRFSALGRSYELCMDKYRDELSVIGSVFVFMASVIAALIIFKGASL